MVFTDTHTEQTLIDALLNEGDDFALVVDAQFEAVVRAGPRWLEVFEGAGFLQTLDADSRGVVERTLGSVQPLRRSVQLLHMDRGNAVHRIGWRRVTLPSGERLLLGHDMAHETRRLDQIVRLQHDYQRSSAELRRLANTDWLTGVYNRRAFLDAARGLWASVPTATAVLVDLDHFKRFNDLYGHETGDSVLREATSALLRAAGPSAAIGRWGGEEFACIFEGDATESCHGLLDALRAVRLYEKKTLLTVTGSIGAAVVGDTSRIAVEEALAAADGAMYAAKDEGRDCYVVRQMTPRKGEHPGGGGERRLTRRWNTDPV